MNLKTYLAETKSLIEDFLKMYFRQTGEPEVLFDAMRYSLFAGGKRIRPILCLTAYETCGGVGTDILPQACALELIHTYSLIHDDLPAMDNDDLRRGKPTNHKVYGDAMAILAGDGLLTESFRMFTTVAGDSGITKNILPAIKELASSAGLYGMVAGQALDIISEGKTPDKTTLEFIHKNKTAALLKTSVRLGGILYGAQKPEMSALSDYGEAIGLAFQVVDDILDVTGTTEELGKPQGSDDSKDKMTYPAMYGIERSKEIARELITRGLESAEFFKGKAMWLKEIANYLLKRTN
ncbi:polyprenyl synthetase family protein [Candidatus Magnetomonas plexicatena]|uniref:polyprenyl synthetase family protein n=1 Tax=Candidatus Magnetomonas plexicatena TaxID=2552947 RepID=UPI001C7999BC|nr:polyprenyl synthetase family protein [Nitrospirales bacterium LBB_01]